MWLGVVTARHISKIGRCSTVLSYIACCAVVFLCLVVATLCVDTTAAEGRLCPNKGELSCICVRASSQSQHWHTHVCLSVLYTQSRWVGESFVAKRASYSVQAGVVLSSQMSTMCSLTTADEAPWFVGTMEREKAENFLMEVRNS